MTDNPCLENSIGNQKRLYMTQTSIKERFTDGSKIDQ